MNFKMHYSAKTEITKDLEIEYLLPNYPFSVKYLSEKGNKCIACGEPIWGNLRRLHRRRDLIIVKKTYSFLN